MKQEKCFKFDGSMVLLYKQEFLCVIFGQEGGFPLQATFYVKSVFLVVYLSSYNVDIQLCFT